MWTYLICEPCVCFFASFLKYYPGITSLLQAECWNLTLRHQEPCKKISSTWCQFTNSYSSWKRRHSGPCRVPESQGNEKKDLLGYIKNIFIHPPRGKPGRRLRDKLPPFIIIQSIHSLDISPDTLLNQPPLLGR